MRIPKQEDFALLLMSELTKHYRRRLVPLSEIAQKHRVSALFLKKIARLLRQGGLIDSKEGAGGGYTLSREPWDISVWQVIEASSGTASVPPRLWREACPLNTDCLPQQINRTIQESLEQSLKRITLLSLIHPSL